MTDDEVEDVIFAYGQAARRAREAGFAGIEIHGANTYLPQQFVSPHSNRRDDQWGQDRLLFTRRVVEEVLDQVGGQAFVGYRFSAEELEEPGIRWEHTAPLIDLLCTSGLSYLHASLWDYKAKGLKGDWDEPTFIKIAKHVNKRIPLIGVGKIKDQCDAETCIDWGADLVAVGRAALSQPDWPQCVERGEVPKTKIPKTGAGALLTWPKGLEEKAYTAANWFEVED